LLFWVGFKTLSFTMTNDIPELCTGCWFQATLIDKNTGEKTLAEYATLGVHHAAVSTTGSDVT